MKYQQLIKKFEKEISKDLELNFISGNQIRIGTLIQEGDKKRIQFFEGIIIAKNNFSINTTITVRKLFQNIGVERTFPIYSPQIKSIKILNLTKSKRSKLYYLRNRIGKAASQISRK